MRKRIVMALLAAAMFGPIQAWAANQTATFALSWQDNSGANNDQEDGFAIERAPAQTGPFAEIGRVGQNVTTYSDVIANDPGNTTECYRVRAFNSVGMSPYSNVACGTSPVITIQPGTPSNVTVNVTVSVQVQ